MPQIKDKPQGTVLAQPGVDCTPKGLKQGSATIAIVNDKWANLNSIISKSWFFDKTSR